MYVCVQQIVRHSFVARCVPAPALTRLFWHFDVVMRHGMAETLVLIRVVDGAAHRNCDKWASIKCSAFGGPWPAACQLS